ncbi:hypothetical protein [Maribellus sp. YY47]|nr:hypothetical protein [Maribellus sp. YY47]
MKNLTLTKTVNIQQLQAFCKADANACRFQCWKKNTLTPVTAQGE